MAHVLKHRQFCSLVEEFHGEYSDVEVRRLSRGKVLDRYMQLLPAVRTFLEEKGWRDLLADLVNDTCYRQVACNNFVVVQKTDLLKRPQPWNSQNKFKRGCSQSKPIIKSADPKDNVIKTSAKSQD